MQLYSDKAQIDKVVILSTQNTRVPISVVEIVNISMFAYSYSSCSTCLQSSGNTQKSKYILSLIINTSK